MSRAVLASLAALALFAQPALAHEDEVQRGPEADPVFTPSDLPYPFSAAVQVGDVLYLSGDVGADESGTAVVPGGIEAETHRLFERIGATLARHGLGFDDVFKCTVFLADMSEWPAFNAIYATHFERGRYPARSALGVNGLALGARVEMECWAYNPRGE
ncbi:MAG: RidA family protein [Alphaproteobacteria bacterium]|nr:MAG: RidA family protein [Alphaproteobacteria bacterium]